MKRCPWPKRPTSWLTTPGCWPGRRWDRYACARPRAGRDLIGRALDVARGRAAIGVLPYLLSHVAIDLAASDRWPEAEAAFHEVIQLARETNQMTDLAPALSRLAWLEARQGHEQLSRAHAAEALQLSGDHGLRLSELWSIAALGELELALGRPAEALVCFRRQQQVLDECGIADVDLSPAPELVELYLRWANDASRGKAASVFENDAKAKGQPWALARAARMPRASRRRREMDAVFAMALDLHAQTPDVFETARTRLAYGSRLRRSRQRARSREQLRAAIQTLRRPGGGVVVKDGPGRTGRHGGNRSRTRPVHA